MKNKLRCLNRWFILFFLSGLVACGNPYKKLAKNYPVTNTAAPDYADLNYWAAHPLKKDPADSVPKAISADTAINNGVDVFFLHPTTYTQKDKPYGFSADINDALLNAKTDYSTILYQASVFNAGNAVYAPRYRQAHLSSYFPKSAADTAAALAAFATAYEDIDRAFQYYMSHYNQNKPIIIAAHSQGTTHAKTLLKKYFDGKALQSKLIAAYIIGIPVEPDYFATLTPCVTPEQIGCFCTWRTYKQGFKPYYVKKEKYRAVVTNPITWTANEPNAKRSENKGGVIRNFNKVVPNVIDANVADGVLWAERPRFFGSILYRTKNYHIGDINLYYMNIRENVQQRISAYKKSKGL